MTTYQVYIMPHYYIIWYSFFQATVVAQSDDNTGALLASWQIASANKLTNSQRANCTNPHLRTEADAPAFAYLHLSNSKKKYI